jgi:hypothetical protein
MANNNRPKIEVFAKYDELHGSWELIGTYKYKSNDGINYPNHFVGLKICGEIPKGKGTTVVKREFFNNGNYGDRERCITNARAYIKILARK